MNALLDRKMTMQEVNAISSLGLAHMGDAVYEIMVRAFLLEQGNTTGLHQKAVALVCAPAQAEAIERILPRLSEVETSIYRRGRNTNVHNIPKNATHAQYSRATGLETLFGALYLLGETERLKELFSIIMEGYHAT